MASQPIYQIYAELCDYKPKIWRRFQVANNVTMARLGYILMTLFEMQASHLFCFDLPFKDKFRRYVDEYDENDTNIIPFPIFNENLNKKYIRIELMDNDYDDFYEQGNNTIDATVIKVKNVLDHQNETVTFTYDYGDNWEVSVVLEEIIIDKELPGRELPRVLEGAGYGIIEDCGGVWGLEEIAKAFNKKSGRKYMEYCQWLGLDDLDLTAFDLDDMNFRLKKVPRIYADLYEYDLEPTKRSLDILERKYLKSPELNSSHD